MGQLIMKEDEDACSGRIYRQYEKLDIVATPQLVELTEAVADTQRLIDEAGLTAEYEEWLQGQQEYTPLLETALKVLKGVGNDRL